MNDKEYSIETFILEHINCRCHRKLGEHHVHSSSYVHG